MNKRTLEARKHHYIAKISRTIIILILFISGSMKMIDSSKTISFVAAMDILPEAYNLFVVIVLPIAELILGMLLFLNIYNKITAILTLIFMSVFLSISILAVIFHIKQDCGCFGPLFKSISGWTMVARNTIFFGLSIIQIVFVLKNSDNNRSGVIFH